MTADLIAIVAAAIAVIAAILAVRFARRALAACNRIDSIFSPAIGATDYAVSSDDDLPKPNSVSSKAGYLIWRRGLRPRGDDDSPEPVKTAS